MSLQTAERKYFIILKCQPIGNLHIIRDNRTPLRRELHRQTGMLNTTHMLWNVSLEPSLAACYFSLSPPCTHRLWPTFFGWFIWSSTTQISDKLLQSPLCHRATPIFSQATPRRHAESRRQLFLKFPYGMKNVYTCFLSSCMYSICHATCMH